MNSSAFIQRLKDYFWAIWDNFLNRVDEDDRRGFSREKLVVFIVALILAVCLWFLVNLSRDYVLNLNLPITLGNIPDDKALAEDLPDFATVSVQAEGWKLINLYNNPPRIFVNVSEGEVNLFDQVQQQMNAIPDINVQKVQPLVLSLSLEDKISKKVPVIPRIGVEFQEQYGFIGRPQIVPDSITIKGASSIVERIEKWQTDSVTIRNVRDDISREVTLQEPHNLITVSQTSVQYRADVTQFTEGESNVFIRTRNLPQGRNISYSPSFISVRYVIPIEEYAEVKDITPFNAFVSYDQIVRDSTGFVAPQIETSVTQYHIRIQSHQPDKVAYFIVVDEDE